ncbi:MAG TPA: hypothetical protein VFA15_03715 [Nitrososphaera sp.]|nr:hypothetical protein [Nitrososphaera sp.]
MISNGDRSRRSSKNPNPALVLAVDRALGMFDEPIKQALYFHLKEKGIGLDANRIDLESIDLALRDIMGAGAEIITLCIRKEMEKLEMRH